MLAQVTNEGYPESWKNQLSEITPHKLPEINSKSLTEEDKINDEQNLPYRFGYSFSTNFNIHQSGTWDELPNGGKVWRMRFQAKGALSVNFLLEDFNIPQGANLYIYNNERTDIIGAYDFQQNNEDNILSTWLVQGEDIWIEYYEPKKVANQGNFTITKVVHGYRSENSFKDNKNLNSSGPCNHDVDCPIGDLDQHKDNVKKSVALLLVNNNSFCTGVLVNNTNNDGKPYLLTANHCFSNPAAWSFRFNWISPNPVCGSNASSQNSTNFNTISGASLKARRFQTDFCLVEINNNIPPHWDVVYAGWDRTDNIPNRTFGVHHPAGDIMKVCRDDDAPGKLNQGGELVWRVFNWELGVTQGGSSGSPLFDEDGRVVGQLWRGTANCAGTSDNGGWDEYGRFGVSWDAGNSSSNRLRDWLDPSNKGDLIIDQYPPLQVFSLDASISILNIEDEICSTTIEPILRISNQGENTLTTASINYGINGSNSTFNWTGSLTTGSFEDIQLDPISLTTEEGVFEASISNPNNSTDENLNNTSSIREFEISPTYETNTVQLTLNLDDYPGETTWEFTNSSGEILYSGGPYQQSETITESFQIDEDDCFTFTIYDDFGDGICCGYGQGSFQLTSSDGSLMYEGGEFEDEDSFTFNNYIVLSTATFNLEQQIILYPNPAKSYVTIESASSKETDFTIYDIRGKQVLFGSINHQKERIDVSRLQTGMYLVKVSVPNTNLSTTKKLLVK